MDPDINMYLEPRHMMKPHQLAPQFGVDAAHKALSQVLYGQNDEGRVQATGPYGAANPEHPAAFQQVFSQQNPKLAQALQMGDRNAAMMIAKKYFDQGAQIPAAMLQAYPVLKQLVQRSQHPGMQGR